MAKAKRGAGSSDEVLARLNDLAQRARTGDSSVLGDVEPLLDALRRALAADVAPFRDSYAGVVDYPRVIGANLRRIRDEAELTQAQVADAMQRLRFDWKRITVTQIEGATRRVSLEELISLAALYGLPVLELLWPRDDETVELYEGGPPLDAEDLQELLVGKRGRQGTGGIDWEPALRLAGPAEGEEDIRPAVALWQRRRNQRTDRRDER